MTAGHANRTKWTNIVAISAPAMSIGLAFAGSNCFVDSGTTVCCEIGEGVEGCTTGGGPGSQAWNCPGGSDPGPTVIETTAIAGPGENGEDDITSTLNVACIRINRSCGDGPGECLEDREDPFSCFDTVLDGAPCTG